MRPLHSVLLILLFGVVQAHAESTTTSRQYFFAENTTSCLSGSSAPNPAYRKNPDSACAIWSGCKNPSFGPYFAGDRELTSYGNQWTGSYCYQSAPSVAPFISLKLHSRLCPVGESFQDGLQACRPYCELPESWNEATQQCELPSCPAGKIYNVDIDECVPECDAPTKLNIVSVGGEWKPYCEEVEDNDSPQNCEKVLGYVTDSAGVEHQICADSQAECEATGGTYGVIGYGDEFQRVCLPPDYGDDLPTCDDQGVVIITDSGYICESPEPPDNPDDPDVPDSENPLEKDTDGDGIPDKNDPDIDGDGTPNGSDTDKDGDGIPDVDDPSPGGDGDDESSVNGGGSCESRPACKGDAVQCASLYQLWSMRCEGDGAVLKNNEQCVTVPECEGPAYQCAALIDNWRSECLANQVDGSEGVLAGTTGALLDDGDTDLSLLISDTFDQTATTSSCPVPIAISITGGPREISFQPACDLAEMIRPVVIVFFSFLSFRTIMGAF